MSFTHVCTHEKVHTHTHVHTHVQRQATGIFRHKSGVPQKVTPGSRMFAQLLLCLAANAGCQDQQVTGDHEGLAFLEISGSEGSRLCRYSKSWQSWLHSQVAPMAKPGSASISDRSLWNRFYRLCRLIHRSLCKQPPKGPLCNETLAEFVQSVSL